MKVKNVLKTVGFFLIVALFAFNWLFGFEPQVIRYSNEPIPDFTFKEYMEISVEANGNSAFTKTLITLVYPGAKAGRVVNNLFAGI
jgi:hypothetical protein